jgi:hypothetical protein
VCVAYEVDTLAALLHFVKVVNYVVTFFGGKAIECPHVDNEGLVSPVVVHAFEASPHFEGRLALVHMDHLSHQMGHSTLVWGPGCMNRVGEVRQG